MADARTDAEQEAWRRALPPVRRNDKDVSLGFMLAFFALIGGSLLGLIGVAYLLFPGEIRDNRFAQPFPAYPAPQLQPNPPADMQRFYAEEMRRLNGAGWQDRQAGTVHIPISQAMRAVAAEGIGDWPTGDARASQGDRR